MFVRKFPGEGVQHQADAEYDQWSLVLQARSFIDAEAKGNDEALAAFYHDQGKIKSLFVDATKGNAWNKYTYKTVSSIVRKYGYRG